MKDVKATIIGLVVFGLISFPAFSAEYKSDEVIVKFRSDNVMSKAALSEGAEGENRSMVVAVDDADEAINSLADMEGIEYAEPNYVIEAESIPEDWPYLETEWEDIDLAGAWDLIETSGAGELVVVAVIDSGVDLDHPDLVDILIDGHDFANNDSTPEDDTGHGTRVTGILAAMGNNGIGVAGIAWNVEIAVMPLKFMKMNDGKTTGSLSDAVDAIYYAVDHGADIINASWGFDTYSYSLGEAIKYAQRKGVLFIASAGNSSQDNDAHAHYPSNYKYDNVIAVAAMNRYGDLASFSNYGKASVDIAAPGEGLKTTNINGGYSSWVSGTSYATPFVSAVAAMVISQSPDLSYSSVRGVLLNSAVVDDNYNDLNSGGCVNAYNALTAEDYDFLESSMASGSSSQVDSSMLAMAAAGEGSGSKGCMIDSARNAGSASGILIFMIMIVLFQMSRVKHLE
ncbi:MAG: S8 family serine peptidase [Deltaproteobacteria bacterium]|nr:S8 family serine peptidase [Deltaproteobacteria bacterium]